MKRLCWRVLQTINSYFGPVVLFNAASIYCWIRSAFLPAPINEAFIWSGNAITFVVILLHRQRTLELRIEILERQLKDRSPPLYGSKPENTTWM